MSPQDLAVRVGICAGIVTAAACAVLAAHCYLFPYRAINDDGPGVIIINEWTGTWSRADEKGYGGSGNCPR